MFFRVADFNYKFLSVRIGLNHRTTDYTMKFLFNNHRIRFHIAEIINVDMDSRQCHPEKNDCGKYRGYDFVKMSHF